MNYLLKYGLEINPFIKNNNDTKLELNNQFHFFKNISSVYLTEASSIINLCSSPSPTIDTLKPFLIYLSKNTFFSASN